MSAEKIGVNPFARFRGMPFLTRDRSGRTIFYDNGPTSYGYVVSDPRKEWAIRDAIQRFELVDSLFAYVMIVPAVISIFSLGNRYTDRALAALSICLVVVVIGRVLERSWYFGELVAGLERTEPLDLAERRKGNLLVILIGVLYLCFVSWRILSVIGVA